MGVCQVWFWFCHITNAKRKNDIVGHVLRLAHSGAEGIGTDNKYSSCLRLLYHHIKIAATKTACIGFMCAKWETVKLNIDKM